MDLWVVAAAAGAGYLAKYWKRLSKDGGSSCHLSSEDNYFKNPDSPSCPFRRQPRREKLGKDVSSDRRALDEKSSLDGLVTVEVASNGGFDREKVRGFRNCNQSDFLSVSNLPLSFSPNESFKDIEDGNEQRSNLVGNYGFLLPDSSAGEVSPVCNSSGNKISLRTKNLSGHVNRPLNSLESCLVAQLYKEHAKMEEYVFNSLSSPSMTTRSFLVSDGSRIISRANDDSFSASIGSKEYKLHKEACQVKDESVFGVPSLPKIGSFNDDKKMKFNAVIRRSRRLSSSNNLFSGKHVHTQYDSTFLFSLGISFGMMIFIMENKREMDKLRELLKQNENLVQDLQEELEMKDSMTVKELHDENFGSQDTCDHSFHDKKLNGFSPEKHMDNSPRIDCKESYGQKEEESSESMSKIEAELEAELERLGLNMNASSLDRKLSELVELDPDFVADFAQGELRADMVSAKDFVLPKSNEDASDTTTLPGNYAVSPHELSLRLHEVIQSQLEERVKELEIALQNSQRKVRLMESEHEGCSQQDFPSHERASSLTRGSPLTYDDCDPMAQTLVMNLSGEALDAYNEAYEELIKIDDSEENSPSSIHDSDHEEGSHSLCWHVSGVQHGGANGSLTYSTVNGGSLSRNLSSSKVTMLEGQSSSLYELDVNGDENHGCDYEVERQLIRQIVERTKKGSHVFQNAQRIFYTMDEDEH